MTEAIDATGLRYYPMTDDPVQSGACWLLMANHYISGVLKEGRAKGASMPTATARNGAVLEWGALPMGDLDHFTLLLREVADSLAAVAPQDENFLSIIERIDAAGAVLSESMSFPSMRN